MKETDGIDNWTEDDFKLPQVEIPSLDDPWAVDTRSSASDSAKPLLRDSDDHALSKEATPSKSGIYVPTVDRIRPYVQPTMQRIDQNGSRTTTGVENALGAPSLQDGRSTDVANLIDSEADKPEPGKNNAPPTRIPRAQRQLRLPSPLFSQARREPSSDPISQEEADLLVDSAFKGATFDDSLPDTRDDPPELEEDDLPFFDDWFDSHSTNEGDDQDAFTGYEEPDPNAEYDAGLHETLHQATQSKRNLRRNLEIDEWLSKIDYLDDAAVQEIKDTLMGFSVQRCNSWFRWMRLKQWDALLLVEFCRVWSDFESYSDLRKGLRWSNSGKRWYEIETRSGWTFENQLLLLERSMRGLSGQLIDYEWLSDWQASDPWLRVRNRFFTFASFAVYRSSLNDTEDWQLRPDFGVDFVTSIEHHRYERSISYFNPGHSSMLSSNSLESWFSNQDWYPTNESEQC